MGSHSDAQEVRLPFWDPHVSFHGWQSEAEENVRGGGREEEEVGAEVEEGQSGCRVVIHCSSTAVHQTAFLRVGRH